MQFTSKSGTCSPGQEGGDVSISRADEDDDSSTMAMYPLRFSFLNSTTEVVVLCSMCQ